jgi:hypothetical protein
MQSVENIVKNNQNKPKVIETWCTSEAPGTTAVCTPFTPSATSSGTTCRRNKTLYTTLVAATPSASAKTLYYCL